MLHMTSCHIHAKGSAEENSPEHFHRLSRNHNTSRCMWCKQPLLVVPMQPRYSARGKVARNVMRAGRRSRPPCTTLGSPFRSSDGQRKFQLKLRARHQSGRTYSIVVGMCTVIGRRGIEPRFTQTGEDDSRVPGRISRILYVYTRRTAEQCEHSQSG